MTGPAPARRALVVRHEPIIAAGHVGERARQRGFALTEVDTDFPAGVDSADLVIVLGSVQSVYDPDVAWVPAELRLLTRAVERDVPVLGICFGAQILAKALGGTVSSAETPEFGWYTIESDRPVLVEEGLWLESHRDAFTVPPGAVEIARSPAGPQAYTVGPHMGVQFHPEVTVATLGVWADGWRRHHRDLLTDAEIDRILAEARACAGSYRLRAHRLFDAFLAHAFD